MKNGAAAAIGILAALMGALSVCRPAGDGKATDVVRERYVCAEGKVEIRPGFEVEVGSGLEGKVAGFPVNEGDWVNRGDVIAVMEDKDIRARLKEAEADLAVSRSRLREIASGARAEEVKGAAAVLGAARADLQYEQASLRRYRALYERGFVTRQLLDEKERLAKNAEARVTKATEEKLLLEKGPKQETIRLQEDLVSRAAASVEYQRRLLEKAQVTAPISGKIIRKYVEAGESVTKERPLAAIADITEIWVSADVDETDIGTIRVGDAAEVRADAFPESFKGQIERIADYAGSRQVRPNNQAKNLDMKVVQVKILLREQTGLKPGMTVEVKIKPR
jgi:HlyD family secretion protein